MWTFFNRLSGAGMGRREFVEIIELTCLAVLEDVYLGLHAEQDAAITGGGKTKRTIFDMIFDTVDDMAGLLLEAGIADRLGNRLDRNEGDLGYKTAYFKDKPSEETVGKLGLGAGGDYEVAKNTNVGGGLEYEFGSDSKNDTKATANELTLALRGNMRF